MRKITQQALNAFNNTEAFNSSNTQVKVIGGNPHLFLHGNHVARRDSQGRLSISDGGYGVSRTTSERLNAFGGVRLNIKKGEWVLNGETWNGEWIMINW